MSVSVLPKVNTQGAPELQPRPAGLVERLFTTLKPCSVEGLESGKAPRYFARPVAPNGDLLKLELSAALYFEMSGGSSLVPAEKDYSALFHHTFRFLCDPATGIAHHCDVVGHRDVRHRMTLQELEGVDQITLTVRPANQDRQETRWVTRMPQNVTDLEPYFPHHGLELLRALDKETALQQGHNYGEFRFDGVSFDPKNQGLLFTYLKHKRSR